VPQDSYAGRVAILTRHRPPDDPELLAARRALKADRAQRYITDLVTHEPPLTDDQRSSLAALLAPAGGAA
jgi:hypothetical protein